MDEQGLTDLGCFAFLFSYEGFPNANEQIKIKLPLKQPMMLMFNQVLKWKGKTLLAEKFVVMQAHLT